MPVARRAALALAAVVLAALAACGGDDDGDRDAYVEAATQQLRSGDALAEDDARCLAEALVDGVGPDTLAEAGVEPGELLAAEDVRNLDLGLDEATAERVAEDLVACDLDLATLVANGLTAQLGGASVSAASTQCVADQLEGSDALVDAYVAGLLGDARADAEGAGRRAGIAAIAACPDLLTELFLLGAETNGLAVTPELETCVRDAVRARGAELADALGGSDRAAANALAAEVLTPCIVPGG